MDEKLRRKLEARLGDGRASGYPDATLCWEWQLVLDKDGYGVWSVKPLHTSRAHRVAWLVLIGSIPDDMVLDHQCRNRRCINPAHLRVATKQRNATLNNTGITARNAAKTHGDCGHPLAANPYVKGRRRCPTCAAEANRENQRRRKRLGLVPLTPVPPLCRKGLHRLLDDEGKITEMLRVRSDGRRECRGCERESAAKRAAAKGAV